MSGGAKSPTAPDLSKQTDQANQTFDTATGNAQQTANTAAAYNAKSQDTINNVVGQETPMVSAVNNAANSNLSTYANTFTPLQQQQADQATAWGSDANVQNQQGRAVADQNAQSQAALAAQRQSLASEGVDPASIHGGALDAQARIQGAAAAAGASNNAAVNTQLQSQQLVNQANQLGVQVGAAGTTQAATGSSIGNQTASTQAQVNAEGVNNTTAANGALGVANNSNTNALNVAQGGFNDQQTVYKDDMANSASTMSQIGQVAGMASMFMEEGGPVPHGSSGIPPRFMDPKMATGLVRGFYERGGPVSAHGALPTSPVPGSTDTKPAMLTPDEFVIPRDAATWKGHEHWYKQIDKAREDQAERRGLPPRPTSALTMRGH